VVEREGTRADDVARVADRVVAAYMDGEPYLPALGELCALCEREGLDHAEVLQDAARRVERAAQLA